MGDARTIDFDAIGISAEDFLNLIEGCETAKKRAYCRYSNFRVGAALLTKDKKIILGCNVENASYGLTICAERTAICTAVAEGQQNFTAIAVTTDLVDKFATPCGMCRQFIVEFAPHAVVILVKPGYSRDEYLRGTGIEVTSAEKLLPNAFTPKDLGLKKVGPS